MAKVNPLTFGLLVVLFGCIGPSSAIAADDNKVTLDQLLKIYRELELPLPPKDALLLRYERFTGGIEEVRHVIGFQLEPGTKRLSPKILDDTEAFQSRSDIHAKALAPEPDSLKEDDCYSLITAIQCHHLGWTPLAESMLTRCQARAPISPDKDLIEPAWRYWEEQLTSPTSDRAKAFKHLKKLIKSDKELDNEFNQKLVKSLELALVPSNAKPGSIEALIDDLVDYNANFQMTEFFQHGPRCLQLAEKGFEAVPALIEHLTDDRLTRSEAARYCGPIYLRVGDIVSHLIQGLAGENLKPDLEVCQNDEAFPPVFSIDKDKVNKWWKRTSMISEEQYAVDHVMLRDGGKEDEKVRTDHLLHLIALKYPKHLPKLYRAALEDHPSVSSNEVAHAIGKSKLSKEEKMALFVYAAGRPNLEDRYDALGQIKHIDKERYTKLLLETLENLPKDISQGDYLTCPEARYANLASESSDPRIWRALEKATKRACVGLRCELLNYAACWHADGLHSWFLLSPASRMEDDEISDEQRKRLLTFLATFLDDVTIRDTSSDPEKYRGWGGLGYDFPLAVQDVAAMAMAPYLNIEIKFNFHSTREELAKVREQVGKAWKREQEPALKSDSGKGKER
ncbi:MAG: hypothetical protein ACJ8FY_07930 [Gemmataceae bacterium]